MPANGRVVLCPYCKVPMEYHSEVERTGERRRVSRYYRCPVCGAKIVDDVFEVRRAPDGSLIIRHYVNGVGAVVGGRPRRPRRAGARRLAPRR